MPLPTESQPWPPQSMVPVYAQVAANDAWLAGTVNGLDQATSLPSTTGAIVTALRNRLFGGVTATTGAPSTIHVPVPAAISRLSAAVLFGDLFKAEFTDDDDSDDDGNEPAAVYEALTKRVNELLDDSAHAALMEAAEFASAHCGAFVRVSWDKAVVPTGAFLTVRAADTAVPTFRFGRLTSVTYWDALPNLAGRRYVLLESHDIGVNSLGLYESQANGTLGDRVPLSVHPSTNGLPDQVLTGSNLLTSVYLPNLKPSRSLRKDAIGSVMGRSDYDECGDLFGMLDNVMTSWERDFRLGKTRVMVPKDMLSIGRPGTGASFNTDQELYVQMDATLGAANNEAGGPLQVIQPDIRTEPHMAAAQALFERIYAAAGYSAQSFGEAGDMAKTATEVTNREKSTLTTRNAKIVLARPVLVNLLAVLLDVDKYAFPALGVTRGTLLPVVTFPDAVSEDTSTIAANLQTLTLAEAISTEQKVRRLNPDWDDEMVRTEVEAIKEEYNVTPAVDPELVLPAPTDTPEAEDANAQKPPEPEPVK